MYESPINIIQGEMQMQLEGEVYKAIQKVGVDVDKEELLKALQYDREQYKKGYNDAIEEFAEIFKRSFYPITYNLGESEIDRMIEQLRK